MNKAIIALACIVAGVVIGSVVAPLVKRLLSRPSMHEALRGSASVGAGFVFWLFVSAGALFAVGQTSPETLSPMPSQILTYFPRVIVAGVFVIVGKVIGSVVALTVGRAAMRVTGQRQVLVERLLRSGVLMLFVLMAVGQLGIDTTIVNLLLTGVIFAVCLSAALLVGLGGRDVARQIAAGRYLRGILAPGMLVRIDGQEGTIEALRPATLALLAGDGSVFHIPNADVLSGPLHLLPADE